jgi:amino acid transporter
VKLAKSFLLSRKKRTTMHSYSYNAIIAALVVAFLLTMLFSVLLKHKGPWGGLWVVFIIIFLASWAANLWINPIGPQVLGVSVVPIVIVGIIIAVILAAVSRPETRNKPANIEAEGQEPPKDAVKAVTVGVFYWALLVILIFTIIGGYYRGGV